MNSPAEIDIKAVAAKIWRRRWWVIATSVVTTVVAVVGSLLLPNIYRAEALLSPNYKNSTSALGSFASQYGGLASIAGINFAGPSGDKTTLALETIQSRRFLGIFLEEHDQLVALMAAKGWDSERNELIIDESIYDHSAATWVRKVAAPRKPKPSLQEAVEELRKLISVHEDSDTGFVTVTVDHFSPVVAHIWVDWLVADINEFILKRDVEEAQNAISYLEDQLGHTSLAGLQTVLFRLIEEQLKTVMLANATSEYVFRTIDPAVTPERKIRPRRVAIAFAGLAIGVFLGTLLSLLPAAQSRTTSV